MSESNSYCVEHQVDGELITVQFSCPNLLEHDIVQKTGDSLLALQEDHEDCDWIVDFQKVEGISSAAIGKLITMKRRIDRNERKIVLCNMQPIVTETFVSGRLSEYFAITSDLESAKKAIESTN